MKINKYLKQQTNQACESDVAKLHKVGDEVQLIIFTN